MIRGNLLVIPVKDSLIYVEPVYLRAEQSELPELKRVIVGYQDKISIGETLEEALYEAFGAPEVVELKAGRAETTEEISYADAQDTSAIIGIKRLIEQAVINYDQAQTSLREGDFAGYGDYIERLQEVLDELQERAQ